MAAVSDMAAIGDVAPFDITYEMHAFHPEMSAGRAKLGSRPETDRLFPVLDRVRVTIFRK